MTPTRLNRFLARRGIASRRGADLLIASGRVTVNGSPSALGTAIDPARDRVEVDGRRVETEPCAETLMLNKPAGVVSTVRDSHGRPTVMSLLSGPEPPAHRSPARRRRQGEWPAEPESREAVPAAGPPLIPGLVPVGRLDADSRGLLLLSSDGELTHRLTHPRYGVLKRYRLTLAGPASDSDLRSLTRGARLEDGWAQAVTARHPSPSRPSTIEVEMGEGRKREVRRLCAALGLEVRDLVRVGLGPLRLGRLPEGSWRRLTPAELAALHACVRDPVETGTATAEAGTGPAAGVRAADG